MFPLEKLVTNIHKHPKVLGHIEEALRKIKRALREKRAIEGKEELETLLQGFISLKKVCQVASKEVVTPRRDR